MNVSLPALLGIWLNNISRVACSPELSDAIGKQEQRDRAARQVKGERATPLMRILTESCDAINQAASAKAPNALRSSSNFSRRFHSPV